MKLLTDKELAWSAVVANNNMNRSRNATGVNSYEKNIKLDPIKFLLKHIETYGRATWLDLCCGEGKALVETAKYLHQHNLQHKAKLTGVDLVDYFVPIPSSVTCLSFHAKPLNELNFAPNYDLITCVHGLHYIGNKLAILENCLNHVNDNGCFIANFDINSIYINGAGAEKYIKTCFIENDIILKTHVIQCNGRRSINFGVTFLGADDKAGPNYTGQEAVNAYYTAIF